MTKNDNNPFHNIDLADMMKMWSENPFVKSLMENDFVQKITKGEAPDFDPKEMVETQKKNIETLMEVNKKAGEGVAKLAEKHASMMAEALESVKLYSKQAQDAATPEIDIKKNVSEAEQTMKKAMANFATIGEATKETGTEIFEILGDRMKESMGELEGLIKKFKK